MNIKVRDNRSFGRRPVVGVHCIKSLQPYRCLPLDQVDYGEDSGLYEYKMFAGAGHCDIGLAITVVDEF